MSKSFFVEIVLLRFFFFLSSFSERLLQLTFSYNTFELSTHIPKESGNAGT